MHFSMAGQPASLRPSSRRRVKGVHLSTLLVVTALLASACKDEPHPTQPGGPARRATMAVVSGNGQAAEVGTSLAAPLVIRVADSLGAPARGVVVRYSSNSTSVQDSSNAFERPRLVDGARVTAAWVVGGDVCGQEAGDTVACWGVWGRTGFPIVRPFGDQVQLGGLANGLVHSCGIAKDGKGTVYCWGDNSSGQLGDGTSGARPLPVAVLAPRSS